MLQRAGYQAIIHGHAGGYRSHVLPGGRWTVWHSTARQGAFPPLPHIDWRQGPTQAYYMSADPWPLAVLLHTVSVPNKRQEPGWVNPPTLVWSPDQEEHLRAAWQGDAIRATDVPDLHAGPITHARPAATLAVAQRGQQNPQWVVCMFSPADAHIVVCDPERLPGPEAVIRVADCTRMIIKALREGEHQALLLQVRLKDNARAARPGVWPAAAHPADLELQLAVPTAVYHWLHAFHDLRWRGKPDRQIGSTHWQTWLQADAQRDAIRGLGPAPATPQAQLRAEWVIVQVGAGQPEPRGFPRGTALLVATGVPLDQHMAVHALEDKPEDTGHLVVHQRGGPAWLKEHVTALWSWASTITEAEIGLHDHPAISPGDTRALSVDQLTPSHPDVRWHSADLNAGWLSPTGYYWIPEAWGHTSSDASGGGPCRHATSVALAADLTRTWAVAISGTVPDGEGVAASLPLQYGAHRPWVHKVDAEVILHLLRHADGERTTGVPAGAAKVVNQMPLRWLQTACTREGNTPGTRSGTSEPPRTTVTPYCTRRTGRRPRTPSCRTRPRTLATPSSLSLAVTAIPIYGPPRCGCSARSRNGRRRTMR